MSDFWKNNSTLDPEHKDLLLKIAKKISWKGYYMKLLKRIRKLARAKDFSVREDKLLSKLVNQQRRKGYRNFEELVYYFPGKDAEMLERKYYEKFTK
jgi:hypothetical protein